MQEDSVESASAAFHKTHRSEFAPSPNQTPDPFGKRRVDEAVNAATDTFDPHLRHVVNQHIGPDRAIKSMEEFEALRFLGADWLTPEQVQAINAIRASISFPAAGGQVAKAVSMTDAIESISTGRGTIAGYVTRTEDLAGANSSREVIDRLRLDYDGSPFVGTGPHVIMKTEVTPKLSNEARIPRGAGFQTGDPSVERVLERTYPYSGNGLTTSKDGHLTPEWHTTPVNMKPDSSVMEFKNADGSPRVITIGHLQGHTWVLREVDENRLAWLP